MIIKYFTDNDLYKFTTMNAIIKLYPEAIVKYKFFDRNNTIFPKGFDKLLKEEINKMVNLQMTNEEENYIRKKCYYLPSPFIDFLKGYRYNPDEVTVKLENGKLNLEIEGYWYRTVLWEVPLLALISELYYIVTNQKPENIEEKTKYKAEELKKLKAHFSDFGTRRRISFDTHKKVVEILKQYGENYFNGTSNVYLAYLYNLTPIGTHPHEWFMYHGAHFGYRMANQKALDAWIDVYKGNLGIALTDTYTTKSFFDTFSTMHAKLFDGVRNDSGDPLKFIDDTIKYYISKNIDPKTKTIVFSDSLNLEKIKQIKQYINDKIKDAYGIGTYFTNDFGPKPLNIVIKMTAAKPDKSYPFFFPTVKISDIKEKHTGSEEELLLCKKMLKIE